MAPRRPNRRRIGADPITGLERTLISRRGAEGKPTDGPAQTAV